MSPEAETGRAAPRHENPVAHVFSVRGRPVGFRRTRWGGELVAVERGSFPVSSTGYRSLAGAFGFRENVQAADIPPEYLESLAAEQDKERRMLLARLQRRPELGRDRLGNFISASMDVEKALNDGFFAPERDRTALWGGAYRLVCLIDADTRFQPEPNDAAWTPEQCARGLAGQRELRGWIERLARGDFVRPPLTRLYCAQGYFELPPKTGGEPPFALPSVTAEFSLDLPVVPAIPASRPKNPATAVAESSTNSASAQMSLF
ncbi:MAG: hypothetical protein WC378_04010 [Opitutaceae bacterium]|jgi:hypothetical protein